jgi:23S rRNA (cytidine1920-2'-O)/16S rRNA (cytidine1409-2'-O)-methyltransferase
VKKIRLDQALVLRGLAPSRAKAQDLIDEGAVEILEGGDWRPARRASKTVNDDVTLRRRESDALKFVARSGLKLEAALRRLGLDLTGQHVLDVGQSTGGFTQCALAWGARRVTGVDVGSGQLATSLRSDPRVTVVENLNARDEVALQTALGSGASFDIALIDVSFVSLVLLLTPVLSVLKPDGDLLALVKPQFELSPQQLSRGGIARGASLHAAVEAKIKRACLTQGLSVQDYFPSSVRGRDGNQEYFLWARRSPSSD